MSERELIEHLQNRLDELERRVSTLEGHPAPEPAKKPTKAESRAAAIRRECEEANKVPVPLLLQSEGFLGTWAQWCAWRTKAATTGTAQGKKWDWTPTAAERCLTKLEKWGPKRATAALLNSVDRWQDIYEPEPEIHGNGSSAPQATQRPGMRL